MTANECAYYRQMNVHNIIVTANECAYYSDVNDSVVIHSTKDILLKRHSVMYLQIIIILDFIQQK